MKPKHLCRIGVVIVLSFLVLLRNWVTKYISSGDPP